MTSLTNRAGGREKRNSRTLLLAAWSKERKEAAAGRLRGDSAEEWSHLERAHILSQPMPLPHVRTHLDMIGYGIRRRNGREIVGQVFRLLLAGPGSLTGRYPVGNTGGSNVSAFLPMPIPEDIMSLLSTNLLEA